MYTISLFEKTRPFFPNLRITYDRVGSDGSWDILLYKENQGVMNWGESVTGLQTGKYAPHFFLQVGFIAK